MPFMIPKKTLIAFALNTFVFARTVCNFVVDRPLISEDEGQAGSLQHAVNLPRVLDSVRLTQIRPTSVLILTTLLLAGRTKK